MGLVLFMNILGIIPARGGSKGLKNKNIKMLLGKPMIYYSIQSAKSSKMLNKIVCSTENSKIASIVKKYGVEVIKRPRELAQDKSKVDDALRYTVKKLENDKDNKIDVIVLIYANVPVRKKGIIDESVNKLIKTGADSVITAVEVGKSNPHLMFKLNKKNQPIFLSPIKAYRRQDLPNYYLHDGSVLVMRKKVLMDNNGPNVNYPFLGEDIRVVIENSLDVVDVDEEIDYYLAKTILENKK